jgi:hypothetical protein
MSNNNKMTSLFIPHIFANIGEDRIRSVIENGAKYGKVEQIDMISKKSTDGKSYNSAYIHFKKWNDDGKTKKFLEHLKDDNKQTHIVYDKPWYWIVLENTSIDKKKTNSIDIKEFPSLVHVPKTPTRILKKHKTVPGAPVKNKKVNEDVAVVVVRNLEEEFQNESLVSTEEEDETMNLVDATYVYYLEQDNTKLRNLNHWLHQQNILLLQELSRFNSNGNVTE